VADRREDTDGQLDEPVAERGASESTPDLLPIYLREMGATPLLDREGEVNLARDLNEARQGYQAAVAALPASWRQSILEGALGRAAGRRAWTMKEIETCHERLLVHQRAHPAAGKNPRLREALRIKARLDKSRDALISANLRLVAHIAKKFTNQGLSFMDLIQEGNIGLMKAVEKFEYKRGFKFSTYAFWWIKRAITRAIADKGRTIRIPVHVADKIKKIKRVSDELGEELGRKPTSREIARKARIPLDKVDELIGALAEGRPDQP